MSVTVFGLSFEHHREFRGIGESTPRLSWRFGGTAVNWKQQQYEIAIRRPGANTTTFVSYVVESPSSLLVPWPAEPLKSTELATVRVRCFGCGIASEWSDEVDVEAGLLAPDDWRCSLVESSDAIDPNQAHPPVLFRKSFQVCKPIVKARLYITAHGVYEATINGVRVGDHLLAPGWTVYNTELAYQSFDVATHLEQGSENVIGVSVAEGWYCGRLGFLGGRHNIYGNRIGVIAQLVLAYADGTTDTLGTDDTWRYGPSPVISSSIYDGEAFDMAKYHPGWASADFDDREWKSVTVKTHDHSLLKAPDGPPIRQTQEVPAVQILQSPNGKAIVDFGQNLVGWVRLRVPSGPDGHKITLVHTEVLENGECATRPLRLAKATDTLLLHGSRPAQQDFWSPRFTFHGFRYVEVNDWPGPTINKDDFTAIVIHTDMQMTGTFECSSPLLNKLHENIIWSMRGNFVGVPTDCPQRDERLGWTGDLQAFASTATYLYDCHGMLKTWLRGLASEQKSSRNGIPPLVSPNVIPIEWDPLAIWGDAVILVPWDMYQSSGDVGILEDQYESMETWIDRGIPRNEVGLWAETPMGQLGDWLDPAAPPDKPGKGLTDSMLVANAFLIHITEVMGKITMILGHADKSQKYVETTKVLKAAFAREYITANGRLVSDSQTAIALAIQFSLFPTAESQAHGVERLDTLIRSTSRLRIGTGFAGTPILGHALTKAGKTQLFYRMLLNKKVPSWLYPVTMGATTCWERWDSMLPDGTINPGEMTSFNHYALGSVATWMHQVIAGLEAVEPGWKRFQVRPIPGGKLKHASTSFLSPYGRIALQWTISHGQMSLSVQVPPNTEAEIILPTGGTMTRVGSGRHDFQVQYIEPERPSLPKLSPFAPPDDEDDEDGEEEAQMNVTVVPLRAQI